MGIKGLTSFLQKQGFITEKHILKDTLLIIDGLNLANELNYKLQTTNSEGADYLYGGDYARYSAYVRRFFLYLKQFNIRPLVIMDGGYNPSERKQRNKLQRQLERLEMAKKAYTNPESATSRFSPASSYHQDHVVNGLLNIYTFLQVLEENDLGVICYKSLYDSTHVIVQIAYDLKAPVLSSDSDFFVYNFPGGVVPIRSLIPSFEASSKTLECSHYSIESLKGPSGYPGINLDLVQMLRIVLEKDSSFMWLARHIVHVNQRNHHEKIDAFLRWIEACRDKRVLLGRVKAYFERNRGLTMKSLINRFVDFGVESQGRGWRNRTETPPLSPEEYILENKSRLFPRLWNLPLWLYEQLLHNKVQRRLVSLWRSQVEWFRPLLEDHSLNLGDSSADCTAPPMQYIYGLLRKEEVLEGGDKRKKASITCYYRKGASQAELEVLPVVQSTASGRRLLTVDQMESLERDDRIAWFWELLELNSSIEEDLQKVVGEIVEKEVFTKVVLNELLFDQLLTLVISLTIMCRDSAYDIWIEAVYGLLLNFLFNGYFGSEEFPEIAEQLRFFTFEDKQVSTKLTSSLEPLNTVSKVSWTYKPRIVHVYNAFQKTLKNVRFLGQLLNLGNRFHANRAVLGLQGSFIYNASLRLTEEIRPLEYLLQEILTAEPVLEKLFISVLNIVLKYSKREFYLLNSQGGEEEKLLSPEVKIVTGKKSSNDKKYFIRALEGTGSGRYFEKIDVLADLLKL